MATPKRKTENRNASGIYARQLESLLAGKQSCMQGKTRTGAQRIELICGCILYRVEARLWRTGKHA